LGSLDPTLILVATGLVLLVLGAITQHLRRRRLVARQRHLEIQAYSRWAGLKPEDKINVLKTLGVFPMSPAILETPFRLDRLFLGMLRGRPRARGLRSRFDLLLLEEELTMAFERVRKLRKKAKPGHWAVP